MSKFKLRINRLEQKLNLTNEQLIIIVDAIDDHVKLEHFKDEKEKEAFLEYRTSLIRQEQRNHVEPWIIYNFSLSDVQAHLPDFRKIGDLHILKK